MSDSRPTSPESAPPFWARVGFAWLVGLGSLLLAGGGLLLAGFYAWLTVASPERLHPNRELAAVFAVLAIALVVAAPIVPLVLRRKWRNRHRS
jgi:uncharacterized membrane protein YidH (DUF202 family)